MRLYRSILFFALAASLAACGGIDPESIDDPVNETPQSIVKISVNSGPETKTNVNVEEIDGVRQGVVTFTERDILYLFETKKYNTGASVTSITASSGSTIKNGGKSADFYFVQTINPADPPVNNRIYLVAVGDWSLSGTAMVVNIPQSFDMKDNGGSVLPQKGVIAMSEIYSGKAAAQIFNSSVKLHHLVSYGILNITGLTGRTINKIQIEKVSGDPVAGKATINLEKSETYSDISDETSGLHLSTLLINADSDKTISITPSSAVQESIRNNTGTSIWLSSAPSTFFTNETLKVTLTDSDNNKYYGQYSFEYPTATGYPAVISISSWSM